MRSAVKLGWSLRLVALVLAAPFVGGALALATACSDEKVKAPASDKNFDDPDEPATPGQIGAFDATTADVVVACGSDVECPPRAARCMFRVSDGCGATGTCVNYMETTACPKARFCDCLGVGTGVSACAPPGLAPIPVNPSATCVQPDAAPSTDASGATDASDAMSESG